MFEQWVSANAYKKSAATISIVLSGRKNGHLRHTQAFEIAHRQLVSRDQEQQQERHNTPSYIYPE